jgi:hypothetical protein
MKIFKRLIFVLIIFLLGCGESKIVKRLNVGSAKNINYSSTTLFENAKTIVTTETSVFIVSGMFAPTLREELEFIVYDDDDMTLCHSTECRRIISFK